MRPPIVRIQRCTPAMVWRALATRTGPFRGSDGAWETFSCGWTWLHDAATSIFVIDHDGRGISRGSMRTEVAPGGTSE